MGQTEHTGNGERIFHFSGDGSHKFWRVQVRGAEQTVHFGRIGTEGQRRVKRFADEAAARAATERLIAEKTGKGYAEVSAEEDAAAAPRPVAGRTRRRVAQQLELFLWDSGAEEPPAPSPAPVAPEAPPLMLALDF
jgi:Uncharacterized conserved protein